MSGFSICLTHKIMAIGIVGLIGLLGFGAIYQIGSASQDASRAVGEKAREISDLNKQLSIEMLEARRNEKNFQQRRNESYAKAHADLMVVIDRDFDRLQALTRSGGMSAYARRSRLAQTASSATAMISRPGERRDQARTERKTRSDRLAARRRPRHRNQAQGNRRSRLTSWMLMMRRHEKDFMLRRDQKYVGELKKAAAEFSKALGTVAVPPT